MKWPWLKSWLKLCIKIKLKKLFIENKHLITLFYLSGYDFVHVLANWISSK